ncbi:MAG TPA: hypothetical protein VKA60_19290 [Blastocatellia bacterium]|nr:hypothetical protein [Blastocatellia bacterium]
MKIYRLTLLAIAALLVAGVMAAPGSADGAKLQKAVVRFDEPVKLLDVILKGEYVIVHDDERMAKGEACTYVYTHENGRQGRLVVSFHCIPVECEPQDHFTVTLGAYDPATRLPELLEYRFAGDSESHRVPRPAAVRP